MKAGKHEAAVPSLEDDTTVRGREPHGPSITGKSHSSLANAVTYANVIIKSYVLVTSQHGCNSSASKASFSYFKYMVFSFYFIFPLLTTSQRFQKPL